MYVLYAVFPPPYCIYNGDVALLLSYFIVVGVRHRLTCSITVSLVPTCDRIVLGGVDCCV